MGDRSGERRSRAPRLVAVEPVGAVTEARVPIPVVAMYRWAPPYGDGGPNPVAALAVAWTTAQVRVRRAGDADVWLPARDVHRVHDIPNPRFVVARVRLRGRGPADVPGRALACATNRAGAEVAVRVQLLPGTPDAEERWLLVESLVDEDPLADLPD